MAKIISPLTGTLQSIKKQFISKEKLLKSTLNVQKKRIASNRSNAERERFIDYEKVLERPLRSLGTGIKSVVGKKLGFLDTLKTFIVNLLLGFIALRLLKYLPQLIQFATTALKVGNFILDVGGKILNGLVTFVDYGYQAYDHARKIVGKVGGEKAVANLDKATDETTKVMNQLFIAAMLFSDFSPFAGLSSAPKAMEAAADAIKDKVSGEVASATSNAATNVAGKAALGPLATAGVVAGAGLLLSAAGEGVFQLTKWAKGLIGFGPLSQFFKVPLGILEGVGTIFDILGAPFRYGIELIRAGFMKMFNMKDGLEKQSKNLGKFDARVRENIRRFAGVFAPVFSFFGQQDTAKKLATPGSFGSLYGEKAVKDMGYSGGGKVISVRKYAAGGQITRAGQKAIGGSIGRTEVKKVYIPRDEGIKQKPLDPGAAIGGSENYTKVFSAAYDRDNTKMDRYDYMVRSHRTISGIPDLGSVFALTTKTLLGDIVTKGDYDSASESLSIFMRNGLYKTNPAAYQKFSSLIDIRQFNRIISEFLMRSMKDKLGDMISLLRTQVGLLPIPLESGPSGGNGDDCPCPEGSDGEFVATGNVFEKALLETISQVEGTAGPDGYRTMFGGGKFQAPPWKHPDSVVRSGGRASAAAGKYQFMPDTWARCVKALGLSDFSPANQDKAALWLAKVRGVNPSKQITLSDMEKLGKEWAGLTPHYGQTDRTAKTSLIIYNKKLNELGATSSTPISPSSPAGSVDPCICDPDVPNASNLNISGDPGPGGGNLRIGRTGSISVAAGWGHAHFDTVQGTPENVIIGDTIPLLKKMAASGLKPELTNATPILAGKSNDYYIKIIKSGIQQHGHRAGPRFDVNTPGFPLVPFPLTDVRNTPNKGEGINALVPGSGKTALFHLGTNASTGRESGGATFSGGIRKLHKGEYVIDKDSVDLFGGNSFFSMINGVENKKQRSEKSSQLIQHLSKYTGREIDKIPDLIYASDPIIIQGPPTYIASGSSRGSSGGGSSNDNDNTFDRLERMT
jgi:muramidase (phage lysozyme)